MAFIDAKTFRFKANTGTYAAESTVVVNCERDSSLEITRSEIDTSGKCNSWTTLLGSGTGSYSFTVSGVADELDAGLERWLEDIRINNTLLRWEGATWNGKTFAGDCQLVSYTLSAADGDAVLFDASFTGSGELERNV